MTGWIVQVDEDSPEHARYALEDGFWDIRSFRAFTNMSEGDDVFFWVGGQTPHSRLHGWGRVTTAPTELTGDMPKARWKDVDTGTYTHRFTLEPIASAPSWRPTWTQLQAVAQKPMAASASGSPMPAPSMVHRVRSLYNTDSSSDLSFDALTVRSEFDKVPDYLVDGVDTRQFTLRAIAQRRGGKKFRNTLLQAYDGRCAVTGFNVPDSLEAAHIDRYRGERTDHVQNGLLLRADIHTLFDLHLLAIDDEYRVSLSSELKESSYAALNGAAIVLPLAADHHPSKDALQRHRADCAWFVEL
ncbi:MULTISPECIES: HNH endonuclease [Gordonia]|uniref:HNH endonuclease n=1 Tax=Gordonia TaxID=2053 RepID=UPI0030ECEBBB